jgi:hypothetical protein
MHEDGNFAQSAHTLMREEVKRAAQQEKFDEQDMTIGMGKRALNITASMIAKLVEHLVESS